MVYCHPYVCPSLSLLSLCFSIFYILFFNFIILNTAGDSVVAGRHRSRLRLLRTLQHHGLIHYLVFSLSPTLPLERLILFILLSSLSLAGVDVPKDRIIDGLNVTDALLGDGASPHEFMFFWNGLPGISKQNETKKNETKKKEYYNFNHVISGKYFLCAVRAGKYKVCECFCLLLFSFIYLPSHSIYRCITSRLACLPLILCSTTLPSSSRSTWTPRRSIP